MNVILFIAALPVALLAFYIYKKDKEKEPLGLLIKLLFGGVLACLSVLVLSAVLSVFIPAVKLDLTDITQYSNAELLFYAFIGVALVEESCKYFFLHKFAYYEIEFDTLMDMVIYGSFVSLGFAFFENLFYVFGDGIVVGIQRAFTAIPLHACTGVFMGLYLGDAALASQTTFKDTKKYKVFALLIPTLLHGLYNYAAITGHTIIYIMSFIMIVTITVILLNKRSKNDKIVRYRHNECPDCHEKIKGKYCINCGKKLY